MKIVAMMRVKDAILTIHECLTNLSRLVDEIVIVDNGSTDGTLRAYKQFPKIVDIAYSKGYDEGRDRAMYLKMAKKRNPDWLLWIDSDEIFEQYADRSELEKMMVKKNCTRILFRMYNFQLSRTHFRIDGTWRRYAEYPDRSAWKNTDTAFFRNYKVHCGDIHGILGKPLVSKIRIKHFTHNTPEQMKLKKKIYEQIQDPMSYKTNNWSEGKKPILIKWRESPNKRLNHLIKNGYYISSKVFGLLDSIVKYRLL